MAKKSWISLLKRFFKSDTPSNREKDKKRRRWVFAKLKIRRLASISAPSPSTEKILSEVEEEQSKHAANDSEEDIRLPNSPQSVHQCEEETQKPLAINTQLNASPSNYECEREIQDLAATKIQTAFRGYLARKALRALKGLVRLQAIIRGRAVRRQAITTLKRLQSIVDIQSQAVAKRCQMVDGNGNENKEFPHFRGKDIKINSSSERRWDDSILTREEANALFSSKRDAAVKRERIKEYSFSQRRSTECEQNKQNGQWRYWLEQWVDTQLAKTEDVQKSETNLSSDGRNKEELKRKQLKLRNFQKHYQTEIFNPPINPPRRSFQHRKQHSIGEDNSFGSSPVFPTYMAATQSARAKTRSMSSPRLRPINLDSYSETNSPYKHKLSPISSINSEARSCSRIGNPGGIYSQRSPSFKGIPSPIKSISTLKDLSIDSQFSLPNWDRRDSLG